MSPSTGTPRLRRLRRLLRAPRKVARMLGPYLRSNRGRIVGIGATAITLGFVEAAQLYLIVTLATGLAADDSTVSLETGMFDLGELEQTSVLLLAFGLLAVLMILAVVNATLVASVQTRSLNLARRESFRAYLEAEWSAQSEEPEGRLQQLLAGWTNRVGDAALHLSTGLSAGLTFLAYIVSAIALSPLASVAVVGGGTAVGLVLYPLFRRTRRYARQDMALTQEYATRVSQSVRLSREIRVFDTTDEVYDGTTAVADDAARVSRRANFLARVTPKVYQYAALLLLLVALSLLTAVEDVNLGNVGAVVLLMVRSLTYGQKIATSTQKMTEFAPVLELVYGMQQRYRTHRQERGGEPLAEVASVAFDHLTYAYEADHPVLHDITFSFERGEALGLVGPSGSGKSTVTQILLRLREPDGGRLLVNGRDATGYALDDWFDAFAFVPQENQLLHGTVADNIRFFRPGFSLEAVRDAARAAHLDDDILELGDGYDTRIGPGARDLSGGQKQRLGLARALLGSPSVLVLDEPTSALDMRSEELIQQTLTELKGSVTLVLIAHRTSTLTICDQIVVLEAGRVRQSGTQDELRAQMGYFRDVMTLSGVDVDVESPT